MGQNKEVLWVIYLISFFFSVYCWHVLYVINTQLFSPGYVTIATVVQVVSLYAFVGLLIQSERNYGILAIVGSWFVMPYTVLLVYILDTFIVSPNIAAIWVWVQMIILVGITLVITQVHANDDNNFTTLLHRYLWGGIRDD